MRDQARCRQWTTSRGPTIAATAHGPSNGASWRFAFGANLISIENWGQDHPLANWVLRDMKDRLLGD